MSGAGFLLRCPQCAADVFCRARWGRPVSEWPLAEHQSKPGSHPCSGSGLPGGRTPPPEHVERAGPPATLGEVATYRGRRR